MLLFFYAAENEFTSTLFFFYAAENEFTPTLRSFAIL